MRRADVLGIMAAQLLSNCDGDSITEGGPEVVRTVVSVADALLREAERVSPEPEAVIRYADGSVFRVVGSASDGQA